MSAIVIPEIIIYNTLETIKRVLKDNIVENKAYYIECSEKTRTGKLLD